MDTGWHHPRAVAEPAHEVLRAPGEEEKSLAKALGRRFNWDCSVVNRLPCSVSPIIPYDFYCVGGSLGTVYCVIAVETVMYESTFVSRDLLYVV